MVQVQLGGWHSQARPQAKPTLKLLHAEACCCEAARAASARTEANTSFFMALSSLDSSTVPGPHLTMSTGNAGPTEAFPMSARAAREKSADGARDSSCSAFSALSPRRLEKCLRLLQVVPHSRRASLARTVAPAGT